MKLSAFRYYISSIPTLVFGLSFYKIPFLLFKKIQLIRVGGYQLYVRNLLDVWTLKEVVLDDDYRLGDVTKAPDTVIDIGSALGDFSIMASSRAERVLAFDPDIKLMKLMKKNVQLNDANNIEMRSEKVESLNAVFKKYKVEENCFLKVDCEGGEYKIFQNVSMSYLKKIDNISFEIHLFNTSSKNKYKVLKKKLKRGGFKLEEVPNPVHDCLKFLYASR
jgi:hypothetical protein